MLAPYTHKYGNFYTRKCKLYLTLFVVMLKGTLMPKINCYYQMMVNKNSSLEFLWHLLPIKGSLPLPCLVPHPI
jgi:hypothetical protein